MHIATSTDCSVYIIMWLPFLIIVTVIGARSLYRQMRSKIRLKNIWIWQACALASTGLAATMMHHVGLFQLNQTSAGERSTNPHWLEDGMKIVRFVDTGYYIILGVGVLFLIATTAIGSTKPNHTRQAGDGSSDEAV